ncbi:L-ascorbate oxidase [Sesamum angolense]|uniref:L-ascorbate oxidase n=1 Tax=Sesamum angolense TaxID=2727404 RepID=A0AAE1T7F9_9LAMI|nr:L-ascorbate oxidase [Sesamum angolense]
MALCTTCPSSLEELHLSLPGQGPDRYLLLLPYHRSTGPGGIGMLKGHKSLKAILDSGRSIGRPDGMQINGQSSKVGDANAKPLFTFEAGKTYRFRVCNVGLRLSVNFRVQGHTMKVVEVEGSHTVQNLYDLWTSFGHACPCW